MGRCSQSRPALPGAGARRKLCVKTSQELPIQQSSQNRVQVYPGQFRKLRHAKQMRGQPFLHSFGERRIREIGPCLWRGLAHQAHPRLELARSFIPGQELESLLGNDASEQQSTFVRRNRFGAILKDECAQSLAPASDNRPDPESKAVSTVSRMRAATAGGRSPGPRAAASQDWEDLFSSSRATASRSDFARGSLAGSLAPPPAESRKDPSDFAAARYGLEKRRREGALGYPPR